MSLSSALYWKKIRIRIDHFRDRHISHRNFLILVSAVVGLISALAAVALKISVQFFEQKAEQLNEHMHSGWLSALFPLIGTGISALLLTQLLRGKLNRGVSQVVESSITHKHSLSKNHIWGHIATSSVTVATGGSVGLEAPIVATGAAIGANTGKDLRFSDKDTTLLLACGAAGGIAAVFNSPIAGIIFTLEVLLIGFNISFFVPLLIAAATATVVSQALYPNKFIFLAPQSWHMQALPFYVLLGLACGMISVYTSRMTERIEHFFGKRKLNWKTWLLGGIPLCLLIFLIPGLYGEGYGLITALLHGRYQALTAHSFLKSSTLRPAAIIVMSLLLIFTKVIGATLTTGAGGNGGIFAPSMIIGGITGFLFAYIVNLTGIYPLNTANFIIVAMAGVLGGVLHGPLTAIFLLAEISGGYTLFVPLMIVVAISYFTSKKYVRHSIYHKSLVSSGILSEKANTADYF